MKTKTVVTTFGKHPILEIHDANEVGINGGDKAKALVSFGLKKAEAILASIDEIKKFVEENKK